MNTTAIEPVAPPAPPADDIYRLSAEQYERMIESNIFGERNRVVLWEGRLYLKMTKNPPHTFALGNLTELMVRIVPDGWTVMQDAPVRLGDQSVPEPDLILVRGRRRDYARRRPTPADVLILIEVADSSLPLDRRLAADYAAAGIPAYWIVNLIDRRIEVYSDLDPEGKTYRTTRTFGPDDEVPVVLDGREVGRVAVKDVLP